MERRLTRSERVLDRIINRLIHWRETLSDRQWRKYDEQLWRQKIQTDQQAGQ